MATFNGGRFLQEQLSSLLAQDYLPAELCVGDDGSSDGTGAIIAEFARIAPFPVHFQRNTERLGYGENFLQTAARCSGEWIAFCDQDDIWHRDKLSRAMKAAQSGEDVMLVVHDADLVDFDGRPVGKRLYDFRDGEFASLQLPGAFLCAGFVQLFRASLVRDIPFWPRTDSPHDLEFDDFSLVRYPHDSWIALLANVTGRIVIIGASLADYRRHETTVTDVDMDHARSSRGSPWRNNAERYESLGGWYSRSAETIARLPASSAVPKERLAMGVTRFQEEAAVLALRARLHSSSNLSVRLRILAKLVCNGAYWRRWTMTPASFLKDVATSVGLAP